MGIKDLISSNNIDKDEVDNIVLNMMLLSIFEEIYNYLEKDDNKQRLKNELRKGNSNIIIRQMINDYVDMELGDEEYQFLIKLVIAYLRKKELRKKYGNEERDKLLIKQKNKCNICKCEIGISNSHLDHIIPFKMVGDELENNFQLLCRECNLSKSASTNFLKAIVKRFIR